MKTGRKNATRIALAVISFGILDFILYPIKKRSGIFARILLFIVKLMAALFVHHTTGLSLRD